MLRGKPNWFLFIGSLNRLYRFISIFLNLLTVVKYWRDRESKFEYGDLKMLATCLVLLVIGIGSIWAGLKVVNDEILRIAVLVSGSILSILGFILAPTLLKFFIILPSVLFVMRMDQFDAAQQKF